MPSVWQQQSFSLKTDFLIIGAGITGLCTALALRKKYPHSSISILERGSSPDGASVKNAGFACFGSPSEILDDAQSLGLEDATKRVIRRYSGLKKLREHLNEPNKAWQANGGYEVFTESEKEMLKQSLDLLPELNERLRSEIGLAPYSIVSENFGMNVSTPLIRIEGEASLHSGELIKQLISRAENERVNIRFSSEVTGFEQTSMGVEAETRNGSIWQCNRLILCTNAFTRELTDLDVWPNRGQVLLTEPIPGLKIRGNFHLHQGYFYFRDFDGGILLGGGRHLDRKNEQTDSQDTTEVIQQALEELLAKSIIPGTDYRIKMRWAGSMGFGSNNEKEPIVQQLSEGVFAAVRLGGMGVAMAPVIAEELAELL